MAELEKMRRTAGRVIPDAPHEVLLVLDATTGQNGLEQARKFTETSGVTGIVLTKLDGTAKGGIVIAIARELNLPIRYVGVGEKVDDLLPFDPGEVHRFALRKMSDHRQDADAGFLREALELARQGRAQASPNPMVGAVLVRDGEVVGRGFHTWAGLKHAEILALEAGRRPGARRHAYVNLEPCSHQGRTRPCADALIQAGVARVVARIEDPNPLVAGEGFRQLRAAGIEVEIAARICRRSREAERSVRAFHAHAAAAGDAEDRHDAGRQDRRARRQPRLDHQRTRARPRAATAPRSRRHPYRHRHGAGRRLPAYRPHRPAARRPLLRIVLDSRLRLPLDSKMVRSAARRSAGDRHLGGSAERRKALENRGIQVLILDGRGGRADMRGAIEAVAQQKYLSVMIEAGSKVNWAALESGVVDKIFFYYAPKILGGLESLPMAGGIGRRRRADAIRVDRTNCTRSRRTSSRGRLRGQRGLNVHRESLKSWVRWNRSQSQAAGARLKIHCQKVLEDMTEGASIAVNGVCLTAVDVRADSFSADLAPETLQRSNLGDLRAISRVNLERPLSPSGRLSGHIVQGHVDGTGELLSLEALGDENWWLQGSSARGPRSFSGL